MGRIVFIYGPAHCNIDQKLIRVLQNISTIREHVKVKQGRRNARLRSLEEMVLISPQNGGLII